MPHSLPPCRRRPGGDGVEESNATAKRARRRETPTLETFAPVHDLD